MQRGKITHTAECIISPRWVLPMTPDTPCFENYAVAIANGRIVGIGPATDIMQQFQATEHLVLADHALMPGLVNAHAHTPMNLFRGAADDLNVMDWLENHIWPAEKALINAESVALGSELAIAEMLQGGITCFNDHYIFPEVTAEIVKVTGIRARLGFGILNVATQWATDEWDYLKKAEAILAKQVKKNSDRITWALCPHAPYTVSDPILKKIKILAAEYAIPIHMHLHETTQEVITSIRQYGKTPLQRLADLGLLSADFIAVHLTSLTQSEIQCLADTGTQMVHCPQSNLKLASGFAPLSACLDAGIAVALGTDSAASNNQLDILAELKIAALLDKARTQDPTRVPATTALQMATRHGAQALRLTETIGSLEVGKAADIIAINVGGYAVQPVYHPISHLAYATQRSQVSDVWVAGKRLLQAGQLTTINTTALIERTKAWMQHAKYALI